MRWKVSRLQCCCSGASFYWRITGPYLASASFMYLVNRMVAWARVLRCSVWASPLTFPDKVTLGDRQGTGSSILISQRVTEQLSDLGKVNQSLVRTKIESGLLTSLSPAQVMQGQEKWLSWATLLSYTPTRQAFNRLILGQTELRHGAGLTLFLAHTHERLWN